MGHGRDRRVMLVEETPRWKAKAKVKVSGQGQDQRHRGRGWGLVLLIVREAVFSEAWRQWETRGDTASKGSWNHVVELPVTETCQASSDLKKDSGT